MGENAFSLTSLFSGMIDLETRWGNRFTPTGGTAARRIQPSSFPEGKPTLFTVGSIHNKAFRMDGLANMLKMIKDFPFFNPE
jgi:hypothetical protein